MTTSRQAEAFSHRGVPRIFCIGRNYAKHIEELNNTLPGAECVIFMKPASALVAPKEAIRLPSGLGEIHHEVELVVEIGLGGRSIRPEAAREYIRGVGLGLDLTLRDVQTELKNTGEPWERAKAFDSSAPLGPLTQLTPEMDLADLQFELTVDGETRQSGHTSHMLVGVAELISTVSRTWYLQPGDLIFTGTPEGVGPVAAGQHLQVSGQGLPAAEWITA